MSFAGALAMDLGGTHITCALVHDRQVLASQRIEVVREQRLAPLLPQLTDVCAALLARHPEVPVHGIGLGFCGLADSLTHRITSTNGKFVDATELDLPAWARESLNLPLRLENDARLALLGECYAGAARGKQNVVLFTLGTGVGGAIMVEGKLLRGAHQQAGLLGHTPATLRGRQCNCGALGCVESEASGWTLPQLCREWPGFAYSRLANADLNFKNLFALAVEGDSVAISIRNHCRHIWARAVVGAIHIFDPELVLIGGGVGEHNPELIDFLREYAAQHTWTAWGVPQVHSTQLGNQAGLIGAIPLLAQEL